MRSVNCVPSPMIATGAPGATAGWRVLTVAAVLMLVAVGAYWNSFNVPFLLDDALAIDNNPSIRHLGRIGDVLSPPTTAPTAARPLLNLSLALNFAGDDVSVRGYHVVNWLIHVCAGLALLGIVRRTLLWPSLRARYGDPFYRMWRFYLMTSAAQFRARALNLFQIAATPTGTAQPSMVRAI